MINVAKLNIFYNIISIWSHVGNQGDKFLQGYHNL